MTAKASSTAPLSTSPSRLPSISWVVSTSWRVALRALPEGARGAAPHVIQQVAGAEAQAVATVLGPAVLGPALDAFISGYRVALTLAGILLLAGAVIAFATLGRRAERGAPAPKV